MKVLITKIQWVMIIQVLVIFLKHLNFVTTQNIAESVQSNENHIVSKVFPNMTRGKLYHTDNEILRLALVPKISKGEPAYLGEIPYQVALKYPDAKDRSLYYTFCGASILNSKMLLSAAHCYIPKDENLLRACIGRIDQNILKSSYAVAGNIDNYVKFSPQDSMNGGQWRRVDTVNHMSSFNFPKDDIAILILRKPFIFNDYIKPINVAQTPKEYGGLTCLASGYGKIDKYKRSTNLRKALLEVLPIRTCDKLFNFRTQKMVCTTDKVADVLEGDSGGPLVCTNTNDPVDPKNTGVQVGIVSGGITGKGSIFTRVTAYKDYIARGTAKILIPHVAVTMAIPMLLITLIRLIF